MEPFNDSHHATHKYSGISKVTKRKSKIHKKKKNCGFGVSLLHTVTQMGAAGLGTNTVCSIVYRNQDKYVSLSSKHFCNTRCVMTKNPTQRNVSLHLPHPNMML